MSCRQEFIGALSLFRAVQKITPPRTTFSKFVLIFQIWQNKYTYIFYTHRIWKFENGISVTCRYLQIPGPVTILYKNTLGEAPATPINKKAQWRAEPLEIYAAYALLRKCHHYKLYLFLIVYCYTLSENLLVIIIISFFIYMDLHIVNVIGYCLLLIQNNIYANNCLTINTIEFFRTIIIFYAVATSVLNIWWWFFIFTA